MDQASEAVIRVVGREYAHIVPLGQKLLGKGFDVPSHSPRIRRRVGGDQCNAHPRSVAARPDPCRVDYVRYRTMQGC